MRAHYIAGYLDAGIQLHGMLITAEPAYGNDLYLNVTWRNKEGCVLSSSLSRTNWPGLWYLPKANEIQSGDGRPD